MAQLTEFTAIPEMEGFYSATKGGLRCTAVRLQSGALCLFSPVAGLGGTAIDSLRKIGEVAFLLAPNQYHNKGLAEYAQTFRTARLIAPAVCHARLQKVTGLAFDDISALIPELPPDTRLVSPEGLKTGEVWMIARTGWLVVDAFAGPEKGDNPAKLLKTFPRYGVGDATVYTTWARDFIAKTACDMLVPCHGALVRSPDLSAVIDQIG